PMGSGMLDDFIERKHGKIEIKYDHPSLEPILKDTYGIIVFQEQVMRIAYTLAGFSLAQADSLRRAMSKKTPEIMTEARKHFIDGCAKKGINGRTADKIFNLIEYFAGYGFNKSHSAAYAMISYRTAYLKANFPVEFMCALLTSERDNTDKIVEYVNESNHMGIKVLPPDINESDALFKVIDDKTIRFGLLAVKNVGGGAVESIIQARAQGPFLSLQDLCQRIDLRLVNRKVLESLIKCGALDLFGMPRAQMFVALDTTLELASKTQKEKAKGQMSFFDTGLSQNSFKSTVNNIPQIKEWPEPQLLAFEKEMLGFYVTGHPLARYAHELKRFTSSSTANLHEYEDGREIKLVGLIAKIKQTVTRAKQEKMAILKLEDLEGIVEVLVFPAAFQKSARYIQPNTVVLVKGRLDRREDTPKIVANDLFPMDEAYKLITSVNINLSGIRENLFETLKELLIHYPGRIPIYLHLDTPAKSRVHLVVGEGFYVLPSEKLLQDIESLLGEDRVSLVM
ncbi:MAG: DNA polymerase III subunit alpha, partial [Candidatus Omnitrophota bacterium]|nr:DNA polymerase III subunit alpha [Candidatus Omnitrophota bacterium]